MTKPLPSRLRDLTLFALVNLLLVGAAMADVSAAPPAPTRILLPANASPLRYRIALTPDAAALTFRASVDIDLDVHEQTERIVLNSAGLTIDAARLGSAAATSISLDDKAETVTFVFAAPVTPGAQQLHIDYHGPIYTHAAGLFALDYDAKGAKGRALYTQFESADARRFVPCWDEPAHKATFELTATVPVAQLPVSNMPIASTETVSAALKRVHFAVTPKMSSYLLFFALGDFERVHRTVDGVDIGIVVLKGDTAKASYGLDAAAQILPFFNDYFGVRYPLPKLDLIAGPGQSQTFGAMENWGAIFSFDSVLLVDPKRSSAGDRQRVYDVTAHEMAHQWFGDLVTMQWWDDIWLNEGFASWMQTKVSAHFHPEWSPWLSALADKAGAMQTDSRLGTHPVIRPIRDPAQAALAFDAITYLKGRAVIRMIEDYLGEAAFRDGVRDYMKVHAYGNTTSDDFWAALARHSSAPVADIAHDFTLKEGVPLIRVGATSSGLKLSQERFAYDASGDAQGSWRVPVVVAGRPSPWRGIVAQSTPREVPVDATLVPIVNEGQAGYFRTLYDPPIMARVVAGYGSLGAADQIGVLNDANALGYSGQQPLGDVLSLAAQARPDMDPHVLSAITARLSAIDYMYEGTSGQVAYRRFARSVLGPLYAKLGWTGTPGEAASITELRGEVLGALGRFDDPAVLAAAGERFAAFLKNPDSLSADLRQPVLNTVAEHADGATWEALHGAARSAPTPLEKSELYTLLGRTRDPALARRAMELAVSDEPPVTIRPSILRAASAHHADATLDFVFAHQAEVDQLLEPTARARYVPALAANSNSLATIERLEGYASAHIPPEARGEVTKTEALIRYSAKIRAERLPEADAWLAAHPLAAN